MPYSSVPESAGTCRKVYSPVVFPEGSDVIGARTKPRSKEKMSDSCPVVAVVRRVVLAPNAGESQ